MSIKIQDYFRFIKFSHTVFALPFALIGFSLAYFQQKPDLIILLYVILCMVFARSAAMGFNRYLDRAIDEKNPRTKKREIPTGKISPKAALIFVIIMSALFVAATFFINRLVFWLSFVALAVVLGYSYTKRFTSMSHFILGLGLSLAPIGAYLTVIPRFDLIPILYSFLVLTWVSGFDVIYSLQDYEFDKKEGLNSIPVIMGKKGALKLSVFLHLLSFATIVVIGSISSVGWLYWVGSAIFSALLLYQHLIVKPDDLSKVNLAFGTTNGIASVVFSIFVIADIFL